MFRKRTHAILIAFFLVISSPAFSETVQQNAERSTVRIEVKNKSLSDWATGTVIRHVEGLYTVATCAHVIEDQESAIVIEFGFPGKPKRTRGSLLLFEEDSDICLLTFESDEKIPVSNVDSKWKHTKGEKLFSYGCDKASNPMELTHSVMYAGIKKKSDASYKFFFVTNAPDDGRSGGGIFTTNGDVVGICHGYIVGENVGIFSSLSNIPWAEIHPPNVLAE